MPNHVKNVLKFSNLTPKDKEFILNKFTTEVEGDIYPLNKRFDFDKVIKEPTRIEECPEDCRVNKDSHIMEDKDRPWFDWYAWHNKYWGTKWNCYDGYVKIGTSTITFVFSTAWSTPLPIYEQLARFFGFKFEVRYADEDWGSNCGVIQCLGRFDGIHVYHIDEDLSKRAKDFARRLWNNY